MKISEEGRLFIENCTIADSKRDEGRSIPDSIEYIEHISYGSDEKFQNLDICFPKDAKEKLPVIVSVHGGAYVYGSAALYKYYCADLAKRGFAVVNFDYRLAPYFRFPAPIEDLNSVLKKISSEDFSSKYPMDLNNVFIVGDSAGAQITSQYGVIFTNDEYRNLFGFEKPSVTLRGLGLNCGKYVFLEKELNPKKENIYTDYFGEDAKAFGEKLEVCKYITENYPPSYILSSPGDFLKPFAKPMKKLLDKMSVKSECKIYGDRKTYHVFHVDVRNEIGRLANDEETQFFKTLVK